MRSDRIIIYPKDIQRITGKSERYGRLLLKRIKDHFQKDDHQFITVDEFCSYTGIKIEQVSEYLLA
jgi:GTP-sensing pleiotropic transcriptional regulator CodY